MPCHLFITYHLNPSPNRERIKKTHSPQTKASSLFHLCLPKPPPHHTPKLTATEFAGAVRGAWKHTGAAMSHDPKVAVTLALLMILNRKPLEDVRPLYDIKSKPKSLNVLVSQNRAPIPPFAPNPRTYIPESDDGGCS
uniref:Uncharacterized protein n=1 Tax=Quercus lobata TaxID=97700 RepID=A0A7N2LLA8_QUELO